MVSVRLSPQFWITRWQVAHQNGEYELATAYAHLALLLCQIVANSLSINSATNLSEPGYIWQNAVPIISAAYEHDSANMRENEHTLYFEGLKFTACRGILASLCHLGCYGECQTMIEYINTPENWLVTFSEVEKSRLRQLSHYYMQQQERALRRAYGGQTWIRNSPSSLWKNPYDVDLSTTMGRNRAFAFLFDPAAARERINQGLDPMSEGYNAIMGGLILTRTPQGKPILMCASEIKAQQVIWGERAIISSANARDDKHNFCEACCAYQSQHVGEAPNCCDYAARFFLSSTCAQWASEHWHRCSDVVGAKEQQQCYSSFSDRVATEFGHAYLLLQRVMRIYKHSVANGINIHPLQIDSIPYLSSTDQRAIPWSYRTGIVEVVQCLINEGIDPFFNDHWDMRTILILWRKLGALGLNCSVHDGEEPDDDDTEGNPSVTAAFPILSMCTRNCNPNARMVIRTRNMSAYIVTSTCIPLYTPIDIQMNQIPKMPIAERRMQWQQFGMELCTCQLCVRQTADEYRQPEGTVLTDKNFRDHHSWEQICTDRDAAVGTAAAALGKWQADYAAAREVQQQQFEAELKLRHAQLAAENAATLAERERMAMEANERRRIHAEMLSRGVATPG
ncbi:hypothetical protein BDZ91DRAFT_40239 [Kalaharituber pfeilii]|nr:hypothetical protein BDZ91DRAFT_40239 [Kalaharituber pfeilii]